MVQARPKATAVIAQLPRGAPHGAQVVHLRGPAVETCPGTADASLFDVRSIIVLPLVGAACQLGQATPAMPWLHGLGAPVSSDRSSDEVARRIDTWSPYSDVDPECSTGAYPGIAIDADVSPAAGDETIMVSLAHGIVVTDRDGRLLAEAPGYHCEGSADELEAIAAGDAFGAPTIAIAVTSGGHRVSSTWITLFRVDGRHLDAVFTGTVEERDGDDAARGSIYLLPGALLYQPPRGLPALWRYDPAERAYVQPEWLDPVPPTTTISAR